MINDWYGLYSETWQGKITKASYKHPAKFAPGLIREIYNHHIAEGWLQAGNTVIDPFGGVALGALNAILLGINWIGIELEERFVTLGRENINLWNQRYRGMTNHGHADLIQGDSRELSRYISQAAGIITSPPFLDQTPHNGGKAEFIEQKHISGDYGDTPGQLGKMRPGNLDAAISSPPFMETSGGSNVTAKSGILADPNLIDRHRGGNRSGKGYGDSPGQLGGMKEGNLDAAISSPPYAEARIGQENGQEQCGHNDAYSSAPGQLGTMKNSDFDAAISSPPFEKQNSGGGIAASLRGESDYPLSEASIRTKKAARSAFTAGYSNQSESSENLAVMNKPTFWLAARQILDQTYSVLRPGAHACWVVKSYVKNKQRVDFPGQWMALCEAVGFKTIHIHRAWVVEDQGAQYTLEGDLIQKSVERKSLFRRMAEQKGAPRIDYEVVVCMEKPAVKKVMTE